MTFLSSTVVNYHYVYQHNIKKLKKEKTQAVVNYYVEHEN